MLWQRTASPRTSRHPGPRCSLASASATHLKPFIGIEAAELVVVHDDTLAHEQDIAAVDSRSAGERSASPRCRIVRSAALKPHRGAIGAKCRTRPPRADLIGGLKVSDGLTPGGGRDNLFAATSRMALSSIASAATSSTSRSHRPAPSVAWHRTLPARHIWLSICEKSRC